VRRRPLLFLLFSCAALAAASAVPAQAQETTTSTSPEVVHPIIFPVIGEVRYTDTYGAPRGGGRTHQGQDLFGDKMQELVATADGRITYITSSGSLAGAMLELTADDGWVYSYIHLNNDTPGTDDGQADPSDTFGPGIEKGARVVAGQLVGYLGDSGNAENTPPHLHFEMKHPAGHKINPMASLDAAQRLSSPVGGSAASFTSPIPRLAGTDRVETAIAVSREGWPQGAQHVVLAMGDRYAEALPATVLAAARGGPLLLMTGPTLPASVASELDRLGARNVAVVGSVPSAAADAAGRGRSVTRLGRAGDAVGTAAAVARAVGGGAGVAVLVNLDRFADGVSASSLAAGRGWPILLTSTSTVPQQSVDTWRELGSRRLVLVGGSAVIGDNVEAWASSGGRCAGSPGCEVDRLAGRDRYGTSVAAVEQALQLGGRSTGTMLLGTGTAYPDALASGTLAAQLGGLSVLIDGSGRGHDAASRGFLSRHADSVQRVSILGGSTAVNATADRAVQQALGLS
jgi:putative cell wall-binding protein